MMQIGEEILAGGRDEEKCRKGQRWRAKCSNSGRGDTGVAISF